MNGRGVYHQRGVAVITALLLTTLAITLVASLFWQQQVQVRAIENQRLQLQKQWILRGALDYARLILSVDAKTSPTDNLDEAWAAPLEETRLDQYVENGQVDGEASDAALSGNIIDAQSRYNLSNLCAKGEPNPEEVAAFARLLTNLRLNPALAQATADMMAAAQKSVLPQQQPSGQPTNGQPTGGAMPMDLTQVEDLLAVPGFTAEMVHSLKEFVVVLPSTSLTPVNLNTASKEVLAARIDTLSLADAARVVETRTRAHFKFTTDLSGLFPDRRPALPTDKVSVKTDYFIVNGKVRLNRATLEVQSLIYRPPAAYPEIIWIREN